MFKELANFIGYIYLWYCIITGTFIIFFALFLFHGEEKKQYDYCVSLEVSADKCHKVIYDSP